jgi:hypothetical protein
MKLLALASRKVKEMSVNDLETLLIKQCRTIFPYGLNDRVGNADHVAAFPFENATSHFVASNKLYKKVGEKRRGRKPPADMRRDTSLEHKVYLFSRFIFDFCIGKTIKDLFLSLPCALRKLGFDTERKVLHSALVFPALRQFLDARDPIFWKQLKDIAMYKAKLGDRSKKCKKLEYADNGVVFHFSDPGMEMLLLEQVLKENVPPHLVDKKLPKHQRCKVMWHYVDPVRGKLHNYNSFMRKGFDKPPESCSCHLLPDKYKRPLRKGAEAHVATGDFSVILDLWKAENKSKDRRTLRTLGNLVGLLEKGPNFRLCDPDLGDTGKLSSELSNCVEAGLDSYIARTVRKLNKTRLAGKDWSDEDFADWRSKFLVDATKNLDELIEKEAVSPSIRRKCFKKELKLMKNFVHRAYVCTYADKCAGNNVLICKRAYHEHILSIVGNVDMYEEVGEELAEVIQKIKDKINILTEDGREPGFNITFGSLLPIIHLIPKLHKIGSRIICTNTASTVTGPVSRQVSGALSAIFNGARAFERQKNTCQSASKYWPNQKDCWFTCESTNEVVDTLRKHDGNIKHIESIDFTSLYDFISHDEVDTALGELVPQVFKDRQFLEVSKFNPKACSQQAEWRNVKDEDKMAIDKSMLCKLVAELNSCYFVCGSKISKQKRGTAMGLSPAPFMANLVLYMQERKWAKQFKTAEMIILRYLDDVLGLNAKVSQLGKDIYKPPLKFTEDPAVQDPNDSNLQSLHFLDLNIQVNASSGAVSWSTYDKRSDYGFRINKMPHRDSCIHSCTLRSVIVGQSHRAALTNKHRKDFQANVENLIDDAILNGWPKPKIFENCLAFIRKLDHAKTVSWKCTKTDLKKHFGQHIARDQ